MKNKIIAYLVSFVGTITILWLLLVAAVMIPNDSIRENMEKSALTFKQKEAFQFPDNKKFNGIEDNYADSILLGVVWNMGKDNPIKASLDTKYYDGEDYGESYGLYMSIQEDIQANTEYSRYWHGSAVFIRPLLLLTDIDGIEWIGLGTVIVLTIIVCIILIKKKHYYAAIGLVVSLLTVQIWNIRISLEYIPMFVLMMVVSLLSLLLEKKGDIWLVILAIVSGTMTAFFDFLTTETMAILMPLILVYMVRTEERRLGESRKENALLLIKSVISWGVAYIMTFIIKWTMATLVTGENKFAAALSSAERRVSMAEEGVSAVEMFFMSVPANLTTMFGGTQRVDFPRIAIGLLLVTLIAGSIYYLFRTKRDSREITVILLILGLIPYIRYLVLSNHSYLHEFFTYRAQCVSVMALWGMVWFNIKLPLDGKKRRRF